MSISHKNQKGSSVFILLLSLLIVTFIIGGGWAVYNHHKSSTKSTSGSNRSSVNTTAVSNYKECTTVHNAAYNVLDGCQILGTSQIFSINGVKKDSGKSDVEGSAILAVIDSYCRSAVPSGVLIDSGHSLFFREGNFAEISTGCKFENDTVGYRIALKKDSGTWKVLTKSQMAFSCADLDDQGLPSYFTNCNAGNGVTRAPR